MSKVRPRLCFVGPMVGINPGFVMTQGEVVGTLLKRMGYSVISVSQSPSRWVRAADIAITILRKRNDFDVLVLQVYGEKSFVVEDVASWLGRLLRRRIVMYLHGGTLPTFVSRFPGWSRRVLSRGDVLVVPSPFLQRAIAATGFRTEVLPNVIELDQYPYRHRRRLRPRLLWMRTFYPYYNPILALRTLALVRAVVPETTLVMAGQDKGFESTVRNRVQEMGLSSAVRFAGFLDPAAKIREAEEADIFLNTNNVDNMPVSVIEACAFGLPVVATDVGGVGDLLEDGRTALLVQDDDASAMADAVVRLLHDPELAGTISSNARRLASTFSWDAVYPQWERLLEPYTD